MNPRLRLLTISLCGILLGSACAAWLLPAAPAAGVVPPRLPVQSAVVKALVQPLLVTKNVTLQWLYPTNSQSDDLMFFLRNADSLSGPWTLLTNLLATNLAPVKLDADTGTNQVFWQVVAVRPGAQFFTVTASNFWGESDYSAPAATPPVAQPTTGLSIQRGP